ncbi:TPA: hypothetical protein RUZ24_003479 [Vibrio cholerae]|nr:hypothetical protein [Vibrio cholerae]
MSELKFSRTKHENHVFFNITSEGIFIGMTGGWTVGLTPEVASSYAKFDLSKDMQGHPNKGLCRMRDKVVLTHQSAKLMLNLEEAEEFISFVKNAPWYIG